MLVKLEQTVASMGGSALMKAEFELHMIGIRQQLKIADDRHNDLVREVEADQAERKSTKKLVYGAVICAIAAVIVPLMMRGVGLS